MGSAAEKSMVNNNPHELRENGKIGAWTLLYSRTNALIILTVCALYTVFDNFVANPIVHGDQTAKPQSPLRTHARVLTEEDEAWEPHSGTIYLIMNSTK